jgi:hypothetical protein
VGSIAISVTLICFTHPRIWASSLRKVPDILRAGSPGLPFTILLPPDEGRCKQNDYSLADFPPRGGSLSLLSPKRVPATFTHGLQCPHRYRPAPSTALLLSLIPSPLIPAKSETPPCPVTTNFTNSREQNKAFSPAALRFPRSDASQYPRRT